MSRRAAHYSAVLQVGLAVSLGVAAAFAVLHTLGPRRAGPPLAASLHDLQARAGELVTLIDEQRAGHLTTAFVRAQSGHWQRVTRELSAELVRAGDADPTGAAARGHDLAVTLLSIAEPLRETGSADAAARGAASRSAADAAALAARAR